MQNSGGAVPRSCPLIGAPRAGRAAPDLAISVVYRSAGKGSNYFHTDFLSKTNSQFRAAVGKNPSPNWPVGSEANRGEDMVEQAASRPGAVGYVELNFAALDSLQ
jgi:phosphate transport system substrate-binding protein